MKVRRKTVKKNIRAKKGRWGAVNKPKKITRGQRIARRSQRETDELWKGVKKYPWEVRSESGRWGDEKKIKKDFEDGKIDGKWYAACIHRLEHKKRLKK
jgi:hypothetical protein